MKNWHPLNWIQWLTLLLAVVSTMAFVILFLRIQHVQSHQNDALRSIICRAEKFVRTSHDLTPAQRRQALKFYEDSLSSIHAAPCESG